MNAHGQHCYDQDGTLICGWPEYHSDTIRGTLTVTMGDLVDTFVKKWVVISYQPNLDKPEIIGPFDSQKEAQVWSSEHFSSKDEIRHQVTYLIEPF